jgi:hypothetical protein
MPMFRRLLFGCVLTLLSLAMLPAVARQPSSSTRPVWTAEQRRQMEACMAEARRLALVVKDRRRAMNQAALCQGLARRFAANPRPSPAGR